MATVFVWCRTDAAIVTQMVRDPAWFVSFNKCDDKRCLWQYCFGIKQYFWCILKIQCCVSCVDFKHAPPPINNSTESLFYRFITLSFVSWPLMPIRSFLPENAGCCWVCHTRICGTELRFRDWVQLAQISQGPLCQITWHSMRPAAIIQARDRGLVSSNGRSNTTLGHCGAPCPKKQKCVCVCDMCLCAAMIKQTLSICII